jgi:excisionase family DNA binding protein
MPDPGLSAVRALPLRRTGRSAPESDAAAPPLLDTAAAAYRLGTPERFVRRLVDQRRIAFYKVGKYVRFDPRDLDAWLAQHRVDPHDGRRH